MSAETAKTRGTASLQTPTNLPADATKDIAGALNALLADVFALYLKTKNFHWHASGPHFRDYHLLLDEQVGQIYGITDDTAERVRKIGGTTLRSIGQIGRLQRILDNDADYVTPSDMLAELRNDNIQLTASMRERTSCATSMATWRARACSRTGSTTRGDAPGSCSRPAPGAADFCRTTCRRPLDAAAMADGSSVMASVARGALLSLSSPRPG